MDDIVQLRSPCWWVHGRSRSNHNIHTHTYVRCLAILTFSFCTVLHSPAAISRRQVGTYIHRTTAGYARKSIIYCNDVWRKSLLNLFTYICVCRSFGVVLQSKLLLWVGVMHSVRYLVSWLCIQEFKRFNSHGIEQLSFSYSSLFVLSIMHTYSWYWWSCYLGST